MDPNRGVNHQMGGRASTTSTVDARDTRKPGSGDPLLTGSQSPGSGNLLQASRGIVALVLSSEDMKAVASALNALRPFLPLDPYQQEALEKRMLALVTRGSAAENPDLSRAIAHILYVRSEQRAKAVVPFVPALLSFLDQDLATTGAHAYYTLMNLVEAVPDDLLPYADALIVRLASPGYATRTLVVRVLAALARKRPGSMIGAREPLRELVVSSGDGLLKTEAIGALEAVEWPVRSYSGNQATASQTATAGSPGQTSGNNWLLAILAQLMNLWRVISKSSGNRQKIGQIADDLQDIARWIETEFPGGDTTIIKNALAKPAEPPLLFQHRINADAVLMKRILPPLSRPDRPAAAGGPSRMTRAGESNLPPFRPPDQAEIVRLRTLAGGVENDFSIKASQILDALGMGHLKLVGKDGATDRTISAREFRLALEKILDQRESNTPSASVAPDLASLPARQTETKGVMSEIRRNIDDSLSTAGEPIRSIAEKFIKPSKDKDVVTGDLPSCVSHPEKKKPSFNVQNSKKDGRILRYYDREK